MLSNNAIDTNSDTVVSSLCGSDVDFLIAVPKFPTFDGAGTWLGESLRLHDPGVASELSLCNLCA